MDNQTFIVQTKKGPREFDLENYMILLRGGQGFPVDSKDDTDWVRLSPKDGQTSRQRVIERTSMNGQPVTNDQVTEIIKSNIIKPEETRKTDGHIIPTLTDMGHGIAEYFSAENPFVAQLEAINEQSAKTRDPKELEELMKKRVQTERWRDEWEKDIRNTTEDNGYFWQKPIEAAGDFFDAFDLATLPIPGGTLAKKVPNVLPKAGSKIASLVRKAPVEKLPSKVGEYAGKVKGKISSLLSNTPNTLQADILQETGLEGVHGALQGQEGERGERALEQGALAGLITAGTHGLGGYWLNRGEKLNKDIGNSLKNLRAKGINVPNFSPFARKGQTALTPEELETVRSGFIKGMNRSEDLSKTISVKDLNDLIRSVNDEMLRREPLVPFKETRMFERGRKEGMLNSEWEKSVRDRLPAPSPDGTFLLRDIIPILFENPVVTRKSRLGVPGVYDLGADADRSLVYKIGNWTKSGPSQTLVTVGGDVPQEVVENLKGIAGVNPKSVQGGSITMYNEPWSRQLQTLEEIDNLGKMKYDPNPLGVRSGKEGMIRSLLSPAVTITESRNLPVESWNDLVKRITSNAAMDVGRNVAVGPYSEGTWSWPAYQEEVKGKVEETKENAKHGIKDLMGTAKEEAGEFVSDAVRSGIKGKRGK